MTAGAVIVAPARLTKKSDATLSAKPFWTELFAAGFGPFFLLGAAFTSIHVPMWALVVTGVLPPALAPGGVSWHAHEMLFGFVMAAVAGFLLTAVRNWTGRETASGRRLAGLCLLWIAGRMAVGFSALTPPLLVAVIDGSFLPCLVYFVGKPIVHARQRRQVGVVVVLVALSCLNAAFHLFPEQRRTTWIVALDVVVVLMAIIGGRVIPAFTQGALRGESLITRPWLERACLLLVAGVACCDFLFLLLSVETPNATENLATLRVATAFMSLLAGLLHGLRWAGWGAWRARKIPLLWVLHAGYATLAIGLVVRAFALVGLGIAEAAALHLLTVGAMGLLILGMMVRVCLGHTGRPLVASRSAVVGFALLLFTVIVRVALPALLPAYARVWYPLSASAWATAFVLFVVRECRWRIQLRRRA